MCFKGKYQRILKAMKDDIKSFFSEQDIDMYITFSHINNNMVRHIGIQADLSFQQWSVLF